MNLEKWKIPACKPCNDEYGRIEEELGIVLSMCVDPASIAASGIYEKTLRSLDPSRGKTAKDRHARERRRNKLLAQMLTADQIPNEAIYPGLGERWNRPPAEQGALRIPAVSLQRMVEKIIKGIAFLEDGRLVDADTEIEHHVVDEESSKEIEDALRRFGTVHSRGPGIKVVRAVAAEDGLSALYKIIIWGELVMYASIIKDTA